MKTYTLAQTFFLRLIFICKPFTFIVRHDHVYLISVVVICLNAVITGLMIYLVVTLQLKPVRHKQSGKVTVRPYV